MTESDKIVTFVRIREDQLLQITVSYADGEYYLNAFLQDGEATRTIEDAEFQ